jgi:uncharacterized repeat protein (TIGR01451 family)
MISHFCKQSDILRDRHLDPTRLSTYRGDYPRAVYLAERRPIQFPQLRIYDQTLMERNFFAALALVLAVSASAQPNFIPDTNLRFILRDQGVEIDEDGYLLQPDMVYNNIGIDSYAEISPLDLTGLGYLTIGSLRLNSLDGSFGAFPAFPKPPNGDDGNVYQLIDFNGEEIPPLPENLWVLSIQHPIQIGSWSISGYPDDVHTTVELDGIPASTPPPTIIEGVDFVSIGGWPYEQTPVLAPDVKGMHIAGSVITNLDLSSSSLTTLYIWGCEQLSTVVLPTNDMSLIDLSGLPLLTDLSTIPSTTEIQFAGLPLLEQVEITDCTDRLTIGDAPLLYLDGAPASTKRLDISLTAGMDVSDLPDQLEELRLSDIEAWGNFDLPDLPNSLRSIDVGGYLTSIGPLPQALETLFLGSPVLECMPVLPQTLTQLATSLPCVPNQPPLVPPQTLCTLVNSICPDPNPSVSGHVYIDENENGLQDAEEPNAANVTLSFAPTGHLTGTDQNGDFSIGLPIGQHTFTVADGLMPGAAVEPASHTVDLPTLGSAAVGMDFRIIPPPPPPPPPTDVRIRWNDSEVPPRPGFQHTVNFQTQLISYAGPTLVTITIDPLSEIINTSFPTLSIVDNVITAQDLQPGVPHFIQLYNAPSVPLGTFLIYTATITQPAEDVFPENNSRTLQPVVVGSYDPNDKQVLPPRLTPEEAATDSVLEYLIRFQNTGTYLAERVVITDTLSADLRWDTFRFLESSHPCHWYVSDGVAHFVFNDIMLPDSNANEPESHGHVRFKIRPRVGMVVGESVTNIANIYFDFNEPVITEPCVLAVEVPTELAGEQRGSMTQVHPVPTAQFLYVTLPQGRFDGEILALDGRVVTSLGAVQVGVPIDVSALAAGHYALRITAATGMVSLARFVKE